MNLSHLSLPHPPTEEFDAYIVVSFTNATLVLSIGETVEEVTDSGFLGTTPTLACSRLGDDALIQVHPLFANSPTVSMRTGLSINDFYKA